MTNTQLEIQDLHKSFGALAANDGVTLSVTKGELHAIIGPNGAGKTTLVAQLSGALRPDGGRILFAGRDITGSAQYERARLGLARSFQVTNLFPNNTAIENVILAVQAKAGHAFRFWQAAFQRDEFRSAAMATLRQVGLGDRANRPAKILAHGEQRQLEIAMALASQPSLLLLDEPTAGMSRQESQAMTHLLRALKSSLTILLIEHDMDVVFSLADRITVLVNGRVLATGQPNDIRENKSVQQAYLGDSLIEASR
ncbi:MAG: ABC transporter ATP-binding protein [Pseudomonadota bacterium]